MDVNRELAEQVQNKFHVPYVYDRVDDLLANEEIDAVYIATPVYLHKDQAIAAARAKKHILIEKPLALNMSEAMEIERVVKEENVKLALGFMMRFHPFHQKMQEMIAKGQIGEIVSCCARFSCWFPDNQSWRQTQRLSGGGSLMDMGIHCLDLIQYITQSPIKSVMAYSGTKSFHYEVEDSSSVNFELHNGAYGHVSSHFNIPDSAALGQIEIYGTQGSLIAKNTIQQDEAGTLYLSNQQTHNQYNAMQDATYRYEEIHSSFGNMYARQIDAFQSSLQSGNSIETPIQDALQIQRVVEAAYQSAQSGRRVEI
jgi:predicted dehydrogenase